MTRVSELFSLGYTQPHLDFVDVAMETDTPVFIDPSALLLLDTDWGHECVALIQHFFGCVLAAIKAGDTKRAVSLLAELHEPNETRLGLSKAKPAGRALGSELAGRLRAALAGSEAVQSGLLTDLEDTILMIEGIGADLISDITTNVIRWQLVIYTQAISAYLGIPMERVWAGGPFWDPAAESWRRELVELPKAAGHRPLLLVPKAIVRLRMDYDPDEYYDDYIIPLLRDQEIDAGSSLVHVLKNGKTRVTKKDLVAKFGRGKAVNELITQSHPKLLTTYRKDKRRHIAPPIPHSELAALTGTPPPDLDALLADLVAVKPGRAANGSISPSITQPQRGSSTGWVSTTTRRTSSWSARTTRATPPTPSSTSSPDGSHQTAAGPASWCAARSRTRCSSPHAAATAPTMATVSSWLSMTMACGPWSRLARRATPRTACHFCAGASTLWLCDRRAIRSAVPRPPGGPTGST
jgi:hypothetical protein